MIPFVIDNDQHRMSDVLNALLAETGGKPLDIGLSLSFAQLASANLSKAQPR